MQTCFCSRCFGRQVLRLPALSSWLPATGSGSPVTLPLLPEKHAVMPSLGSRVVRVVTTIALARSSPDLQGSTCFGSGQAHAEVMNVRKESIRTRSFQFRKYEATSLNKNYDP